MYINGRKERESLLFKLEGGNNVAEFDGLYVIVTSQITNSIAFIFFAVGEDSRSLFTSYDAFNLVNIFNGGIPSLPTTAVTPPPNVQFTLPLLVGNVAAVCNVVDGQLVCDAGFDTAFCLCLNEDVAAAPRHGRRVCGFVTT